MPLSPPDKVMLKVLGNKLKAIRNAKGLTLKELAYSINKDPQSIHRVEQGQINPTFLYLHKLCEGLGIEMKELL